MLGNEDAIVDLKVQGQLCINLDRELEKVGLCFEGVV
jgi:hypothetical protein